MLNKKASEVTIGETFIFTIMIIVVIYIPLLIGWIINGTYWMESVCNGFIDLFKKHDSKEKGEKED